MIRTLVSFALYAVKALVFVLVLFLALLGVVLIAFQYLGYGERRYNFASYAEMEAAGMIDTGWLPSYLPKSSMNIKHGHDIDTNDSWASFRYQVGDIQSVESVCEVVAQTLRGQKYLCPPSEAEPSIIILRADGSGYYRMLYRHGI